ncbi:hypothetical protein ABZ599_15865 [Streptomyces misionensis]|uniref:hypothetical protein n=1 Tax=Streptomyces misionensis TaxID=67331 RepID=UPI003408436A
MSDSTAALLRALREAEAEGPSVDKIADHVRTAIQDGVFLPGTKLNVGQIAADLGYPAITKGRAELALQDLQAEGLLVFRNRWRVTEPTDHPTQIAGMLRTFIQTGVYPPGSHMPIATALAREFVAQTKSLLEAWHELRDEGAVVIRAGSRPAVAAVPPFPVSASPAPDALVTQLRPLAMDEADFSPHIIRKTCDQALAWWKARTSPPPGALKHTYGYLIAATLQLIRSKPDTPENQLRLRRTAALALDPHNVTSSPLWRTACIAVVVGELLDRGSA